MEKEQGDFDLTFLIEGFLKTFSEYALREPAGVWGWDLEISAVCLVTPVSLGFLHSGMC